MVGEVDGDVAVEDFSPRDGTTSEPPPKVLGWGQEEHKFEGIVVPEVMVGWENG
jgi:hypothetical protein